LLAISGPLTAHRAIRRRSQEVIEAQLVLHIQLLLPRSAGKRPPTLRLRMGTASEHWRQWMSAMQGGHARFEERRLFKYLQARWSVTATCLRSTASWSAAKRPSLPPWPP